MSIQIVRPTVVAFVVTLISACAPIGGTGDRSITTASTCSCGPDFCQNDPRYPKKLAKKKQALSKAGYPDDLIALLDRDGKCVAAVERSPDGFSIRRIRADGTTTSSWSKEDEELARAELLSGKLSGFYKFNVDRALSCCGDPAYDNRPDWNSSAEINTDLSIHCTKSNDKVMCK